jgi:uroporphyrin-3 C-methyltransferase
LSDPPGAASGPAPAAPDTQPAADPGAATPPPALPTPPSLPPLVRALWGGLRGLRPATLVAAAALAVALWQWSEARRDLAGVQAELARRLAETDAAARETRLTAESVRNAQRDADSRLGMLEARMLEAQNQRVALESLYQELARNRDEWVLAEVESILVTASQQLQLSGNVRAALIALEAADKRLQRADRPHLIPLRRLIDGDVQRLRALPMVDVPALTFRLDAVVSAVDKLPLAAEQVSSAIPVAPRPEAASKGWWSRLGAEVWRDLRDLVRIRVADEPLAPLLAPEQAYFLRENLKLKLLSARLALLARDETTFRADLRTAARWLDEYFDVRGKAGAAAAATLDQLARSDLAIQLPDIADSLEAARSLRLARERAAR